MTVYRWLRQGGAEVTNAAVVQSYDRVMDAASRMNKIGDVTSQIRQRVESIKSAAVLYIRQSLHGRLRAYSSSVNEMITN